MKVAVIGGASSYTPELVEGLLCRLDTMPVRQITLMDLNQDRLDITTSLAQRMVRRTGAAVTVESTSDLDTALKDARYVVAQIRVGGMNARIQDEKLGRKHGIIGQETTGVGGFACSLRTIPQVLKIARAMQRQCPDAFLLNFSNPAGIVTEAILKHGGIKTIGLCNIPIGMLMDVSARAECDFSEVKLDYIGLNHLAWVRGVQVRGKDVTAEMLDRLVDDAGEEWEDATICEVMQTAMRGLGFYCNPYLQYFYAPQETLARQAGQTKTRGEDVLEIEKALFAKYADESVDQKPEELSKRGGAHYSTAACELIDAIENDRGVEQIVCCRNDGAIPTLDDDVSVEVTATIGAQGASALPLREPEPSIAGLLHDIKAYETLTVEAAVHGDREAAHNAIIENPLMPGADKAEALLEELLDINREHLTGTFFSNGVGAGHGN